MAYAHFSRNQTCKQIDANFSPFGHPTQVSVQVQLAATCEYVWPGLIVFTRIHLMIYFKCIYRVTLAVTEGLGIDQNIRGGGGLRAVGAENGVGRQLLVRVGRAIFSYQWVILFYSRDWSTFKNAFAHISYKAHFKVFITLKIFYMYIFCNQGRCLMGARSPKATTLRVWATQACMDA